MEAKANTEQQQWNIALQKLQSAIEILDHCNAPAHIAAHIDLAVHQLQDVIGQASGSVQLNQIATKADPH